MTCREAFETLGSRARHASPPVSATYASRSSRSATVVGEIESTKSVGELYAPLTGDVVEVNDAVVDDPSLVNSDPFGDGWLVRIKVDAAAVADLLDRDAYVALTEGA